MKALLVIDLQRNVVAEAVDVARVISKVNALIEQARTVGSPLIFIQHQDEAVAAMTPGSPTWQFVDELDVRDGDVVVHKRHRDGFAGTELKALLDAAGVTEVVVTGAQSDYCVQTTALSALAQGFDITVVSDAHTTCATGPGYGSVEGAAVVEFINGHFYWLTYPGRAVTVATAHEIQLQ